MSGSRDAIPEPVVVATFKQRDRWSRLIAREPRVKLMHRHVLRSLALCARLDDGGRLVIDPTYAKLAKAARCGRRTAIRAIDVAVEIGAARKARHSNGRVSNALELLLPEAGSNGAKFPAPTVPNSDVPTVPNVPVAASSNGVTADTVIRGESEEGINTLHCGESVCVNSASDDATTTETPLQRAEALHETVAEQDQPSPPASPMGTAASAANADDTAFAPVYRRGRKILGADADTVTAKLLNVYDGDVEDALDALAVAEEESDPRQYIERDIAAARRSGRQ